MVVKRVGTVMTALAATAVFPLVSVAPAAATTNFSAVTIDCTGVTEFDFSFPMFENEIAVTLLNCADLVLGDVNATGNASLDGSTVLNDGFARIQANTATTLTVSGPTTLQVRDPAEYEFGWLDFDDVSTLEDPSDVLLDVDTVTVPVEAEVFTIGDEADWGTGVEFLGSNCELLAGPHVYSTIELAVEESGYYAIRVIDQSPHGELTHPNNAYAPFDDAVMMVYSEFDPADVTANLVACGDEIGGYDNPSDAGWYSDTAGHRLTSSWPDFGGMFDPGTYTVVYTGYQELSAEDWANGDDGFGLFEPGEATSTFELWGPENGGFAGDDSSEASNSGDDGDLASTGVEPAFALWTGLGLAGTGVAITVGRRRAQRA